MLQSTTRRQTEFQQIDESRNGYMQSTCAIGQSRLSSEAWSHDSAPTQRAHDEAFANERSEPSPSTVSRQKTMYKLFDTHTKLFCQGGPWPCHWDAAGKTWSSMTALRRYLRGVLTRGYHLKPRPAPSQWQIVEIEQVISQRRKSVFPADALVTSQ